jgi:hypothetical protein
LPDPNRNGRAGGCAPVDPQDLPRSEGILALLPRAEPDGQAGGLRADAARHGGSSLQAARADVPAPVSAPVSVSASFG